MRIAVIAVIALGAPAALGACNPAFGLDPTLHIDAPPADAPYVCPALDTPPRFSALLTQYLTRDCLYYTNSRVGNVAAAYCYETFGVQVGPIGGALGPAGIDDGYYSHDRPKVAPDGDEIWLHRNQQVSPFESDVAVSRLQNGTWMPPVSIIPRAGSEVATAPTLRANGPRRFLIAKVNPGYQLDEYVEGGAGWTLVGTTTAAQLDVLTLDEPILNEDGLRVMFLGFKIGDPSTGLRYSWRASVTEPFHASVPIPSAPLGSDLFLESDCGRMFVSGLGSVFYAPQN